MKSLLFLFVFICLCSCTITKRFHNPGWHVEWKSSKLKNHQTPNDQDIASENLTKMDAHSSTVSQTIPLENNVGHTETASTLAHQESSLDEVVSDQQQH